MEFGGILHEKIEEEKPGEKGGGDGKVEEAVFEVGVKGEAMNVGVALAEEASRAVVVQDEEEVALAENDRGAADAVVAPAEEASRAVVAEDKDEVALAEEALGAADAVVAPAEEASGAVVAEDKEEGGLARGGSGGC